MKKAKRSSKQALLIIDMINPLSFPEGKKLLKNALPAAKNILKLKAQLKKKKIPVIYVNDNYGQWRSSWVEVFNYCIEPDKTGAYLSNLLKPDEDDYFVLKPRHSGFFASSLNALLDELGVEELIMTGIAGNICVLFTANDAYMLGYKVHVPGNCIASNSRAENEYALGQLKDVFGIRTALS